MTSELELDTVLQRLVDEVARAAARRGRRLLPARPRARDAPLRRRARPRSRGSSASSSRRTRGLAGRAIARGRPVLSDDYAGPDRGCAAPGLRGFRSAIVAPMRWSGEVKGILGVGTRDPSATFTPGRRRPARGLRKPRRARAPQRGELRGALAPGPGPARLLPDRLGARRADLAGRDLRRAGAGGERRARRRERGGADAPATTTCVWRGCTDCQGLLVQVPRRRAGRPPRGRSGPAVRGAPGPGGAAPRRRRSLRRRVAACRRAKPATARCSPCRSRLPRTRRGRARARLLRRRAALHRRRSRACAAIWPVPRAARSSGASCSRPSAGSRALAQQLARTGTLLATELDPAAVLDEVVAPGAVAARRRRGGHPTARGRRARGAARRRARTPRACSTPASPRPRGLPASVVQSRSPVAVADARDDQRLTAGRSDARRGLRRVPRRAAGRGRRSRPGRALGLLPGRRGPGARRRSRRSRPSPATPPPRSRTPSSTRASRWRRSAASRSSPTSPTASSRSTARARSCSGTQAAERITGVPARRRRSAGAPSEVLQRELESGERGARRASGSSSIRRGGEEIWLSLTEAVMRDPAGAVAGRIFAFRDISAERVVEQMKSEFVSNVSHELRTPLTSIYGFAETLLRDDVALRRRGAHDVPRLHRVRGRAPDRDRRPPARGRAARLGRPPGAARRRPTSARSSPRWSRRRKQSLALDGHEFVLDLPRRAADGRRRPREAAPDRDGPRRQRGQVLARRRDRAGLGRAAVTTRSR